MSQRLISSAAGAGPMPRTPFSEWKTTSRSAGTGRNTGAGGAQPFRQRTLRHDFKFDFAGAIKLLEHDWIDRTRIRANDLAHAPELEKPRQTDAADAGIVGHNGQIFGAMFDQSIDQRVGLTDATEAAEQHHRAIADAGHGFGHGLHDLVDH